MLTRSHRLVAPRQFASTVRKGRRAGTQSLVLHLSAGEDLPQSVGVPVRIGFVVSKSVGPAVVRNAVKRRLRHIGRARLEALPDSSVLVVRALPPSATATYQSLCVDFDRALERVARPRPGASDAAARRIAEVKA